MNKKDNSLLKIDPTSEIHFDYVPLTTVSSNISITNISEQRVAFKIKTTVPKLFLVKPSEGIIEIGSSMNVNISMYPIDQSSQAMTAIGKFLIVALPLEDNTSQMKISELFRNINDPRVESTTLKAVLKKDIKQPENSTETSSPNSKITLFSSPSSVNDNSEDLSLTQLQNEYKKLKEISILHEKLIDDLSQDKNALTHEVESLKIKVTIQEEALFNLSKDRDEMKSELTRLKNFMAYYN